MKYKIMIEVERGKYDNDYEATCAGFEHVRECATTEYGALIMAVRAVARNMDMLKDRGELLPPGCGLSAEE